jgi:hypothetical protein
LTACYGTWRAGDGPYSVTLVRRLLAATGAVSLGLAAGVAWSATLTGTERRDRLTGTPGADSIDGRGGADEITGAAGADDLRGGAGRDLVLGGPGDDRIALHLDAEPDTVRCGAGNDLVNVELADRVAKDCELVVRQFSRDSYTTLDGQRETQAEPDSFTSGKTVVAAFQVGRLEDGGADGIGWARSRDGGRTWRAGLLPSLTAATTPAGRFDVATDPVVAYDAVHRHWLIGILAVAEGHATLLVSRSPDAQTWSAPVVIESPAEEPDKEWLVCDNGAESRFRGRCYLAYMNFAADELRVRASTDGGRTWRASVAAPTGARASAIVNGAQPAVRPNGDLVVVVSAFGAIFARDNRLLAVRSTDGGASFEEPVVISTLEERPFLGLRAGALSSVDVAPNGTIYAAWSDCRFRECEANDVVLATSPDGVRWTAPAAVPTGSADPLYDYFLPAVAASRAGRKVAVLYHSLRQPESCVGACAELIDVWLVESLDGGRTWAAPRRLNAESIRLPWLAQSTLGRFLGDYVSVSYASGAPVAVFALASPPVRGELRQAIAAARVEPQRR